MRNSGTQRSHGAAQSAAGSSPPPPVPSTTRDPVEARATSLSTPSPPYSLPSCVGGGEKGTGALRDGPPGTPRPCPAPPAAAPGPPLPATTTTTRPGSPRPAARPPRRRGAASRAADGGARESAEAAVPRPPSCTTCRSTRLRGGKRGGRVAGEVVGRSGWGGWGGGGGGGCATRWLGATQSAPCVLLHTAWRQRAGVGNTGLRRGGGGEERTVTVAVVVKVGAAVPEADVVAQLVHKNVLAGVLCPRDALPATAPEAGHSWEPQARAATRPASRARCCSRSRVHALATHRSQPAPPPHTHTLSINPVPARVRRFRTSPGALHRVRQHNEPEGVPGQGHGGAQRPGRCGGRTQPRVQVAARGGGVQSGLQGHHRAALGLLRLWKGEGRGGRRSCSH